MKIKTKIGLINKHLQELGVDNSSSTIVDMCFNLKDVCAIRQDLDDSGNISSDECVIYMRSGESFVIKHNYEKLKESWGSFNT